MTLLHDTIVFSFFVSSKMKMYILGRKRFAGCLYDQGLNKQNSKTNKTLIYSGPGLSICFEPLVARDVPLVRLIKLCFKGGGFKTRIRIFAQSERGEFASSLLLDEKRM